MKTFKRAASLVAATFFSTSMYALASPQAPAGGSTAVGGSGTSNQPACGLGLGNCPSSSPCCGAYGQCGVGAYCLGGCDPRFSFDLNSCVPNPVCQSKDFKLTSTDDIMDISEYLGDPSKANWVSSGKPISYNKQAVLLTLAPDTVGTLVSSVNYVWYGKISATFTTSRGAGVVTAFILMSDSKDEVDYEFVGVDVQHAQTNYYAQGIPNYSHELNVTAANTNTETHTYVIDWQYDQLTWSVDGTVLRTLKRSNTWNATGNRWDYPQTPSRIQLSLWPAGLPSNAAGTIAWAGGPITWNSPYMSNGYYYAMFTDVSVQCYPPPPGTQTPSGSKSYVYTDRLATNQSIKLTDNIVILNSLLATGDNPGSSPHASASGSVPTNTPASIPGVSGVNIGANGTVGGSGTGSAGGAGASTFSQGSGAARSVRVDGGIVRGGGSVFAVLVAILGVCFWL